MMDVELKRVFIPSEVEGRTTTAPAPVSGTFRDDFAIIQA
jgi:hypothetical protein